MKGVQYARDQGSIALKIMPVTGSDVFDKLARKT
jgi:hypothetical protein